MRLPERLQQRSFTEWNHLVRGLVEVWEIARRLELERELEEQLAMDEGCDLAERLGRLGNDWARAASAFNLASPAGDRLPVLLEEMAIRPGELRNNGGMGERGKGESLRRRSPRVLLR